MAGFTPLVAADFDAPTDVVVRTDDVVVFTPELEPLQAAFEALGLDPNLLPAGLDGAEIEASMSGGIMQAYGEIGGSDFYSVMQSPSPSVDLPDDVDPQQMAVAMLQLLGMSAEEAADLSESFDWTTTLIIPVPTGLDGLQEIEVRGQPGLMFTGEGHWDQEEGAYFEQAVVTWQENGQIFVVTAEAGPQEALLFANTLE
ncbi:MAG: hypothetical protein GYB68_10150 [Chloroflexi bacterium]|nr:hypothetical protein [Chloroflexota bacterium]